MNDVDELMSLDDFTDARRAGRVIGTCSADGTVRQGVDRYRSVSIDRGGLRVRSLTRSGWGSTAVGHGPFDFRDGDAFGVLLLNGHNTAQAEPLGESLRKRFKRWLRGNEVMPWSLRVWCWLRRGRKMWTLRRFMHWCSLVRAERRGTLVRLDENLAVGLVPTLVSSNPLGEGNSFVMHATGEFNGELWVSDGGTPRRCLPSVQNIPLYLFMVRSGGRIVHFAGSVAGVRGLPALPQVRPLAVVDARPDLAYAEVQQSVSGQIGFAADTRVFEMATAHLPVWARSSGAPSVAEGACGASRWTVPGGAGLIFVQASSDAVVRVCWRRHHLGEWALEVTEEAVVLSVVIESVPVTVAQAPRPPCTDGMLDLQITDDGATIGVHLGPILVFGRWIEDQRHADGDGVALEAASGDLRDVMIYGRVVTLPAAVAPKVPRTLVPVNPPLIDESFDGPAAPLEGRRVPGSALQWGRSVGHGEFELSGESAVRVVATPSRPLPGRTVYTLPCPVSGPVVAEVDVLPPGSRRGEGQRGRAGVIFEQDEGNALIISTWLDDSYEGASISSFLLSNGYEDLYDAVWTNVGDRVKWGTPYRLRVAFDGELYTASLDDELVLYRRLSDIDPSRSSLNVKRVGIVANWEWGTDTGSTFRRFTVARAEPEPPWAPLTSEPLHESRATGTDDAGLVLLDTRRAVSGDVDADAEHTAVVGDIE